MNIEISYNNGYTFSAVIKDESFENVAPCLFDDDSVVSSHLLINQNRIKEETENA